MSRTASTATEVQRLRPLTAADLESAHRLSLSFSWPHRLEDWQFLHAVGEGVAVDNEHGQLIGTAMWWRHGARLATLGMVIVAETMQGRGIGRALMRAVMDRARPRALMLNATKEGVRLYEALGFRAVETIRQQQGEYAGKARDHRTRPYRSVDREAVMDLDRAAFGDWRTGLLDQLLQIGDTRVLDGPMGPVGFAIRRVFGRGQVIGPLVAANEEDAIALVAAAARPGFLRIDVVGKAPHLTSWLSTVGLPQVSSVTAMTRGLWPESARHARRYALVSQALG